MVFPNAEIFNTHAYLVGAYKNRVFHINTCPVTEMFPYKIHK